MEERWAFGMSSGREKIHSLVVLNVCSQFQNKRNAKWWIWVGRREMLGDRNWWCVGIVSFRSKNWFRVCWKSLEKSHLDSLAMTDGHVVKEVHELLHSKGNNEDASFYMQLWKLQIPSKVKGFLWRLTRNKVQTKLNFHIQNILPADSDMDCMLRNEMVESIDNLFWRCRYTREIWNKCYIWGVISKYYRETCKNISGNMQDPSKELRRNWSGEEYEQLL